VPIPIFTAGELGEIACAESLRRHKVCLVSLSGPQDGGERGNTNSRVEGAAVTGNRGINEG
jgi:hypothetical protein